MLHDLWIAPIVALTLTQIAVIATSVYLHRACIAPYGSIRSSMDAVGGCSGSRRARAAGSGRRASQAPVNLHGPAGRPHSPQLLGLWHVQFWNVYYYIREARNPETIRTFAPDITEDWLDRRPFSGA